MKASEYLWKYIDLQNHLEGESPEQAQGELRLAMTQAGDTEIVSDTTGETMTEREAMSVLGRNERDLREAYKLGNQAIFEKICMDQQISDDEWHAAKEEAGAEGDGDAGEDEASGEAEAE